MLCRPPPCGTGLHAHTLRAHGRDFHRRWSSPGSGPASPAARAPCDTRSCVLHSEDLSRWSPGAVRVPGPGWGPVHVRPGGLVTAILSTLCLSLPFLCGCKGGSMFFCNAHHAGRGWYGAGPQPESGPPPPPRASLGRVRTGTQQEWQSFSSHMSTWRKLVAGERGDHPVGGGRHRSHGW